MNGPPLRAKSRTCKEDSLAPRGAWACRKRKFGMGCIIVSLFEGVKAKIERSIGQKCMKNLVFSGF
jgi:hypothetical protein